jgi:hypothetical protein
MISLPNLPRAQDFSSGGEDCTAALALIIVEAVPRDRSLDSVPHELEVEDGLTGFRVLEEMRRTALRTGARPGTFDCLAGGQTPRGPRISPDFAIPTSVGLHIDPLSLIVPVSRTVYSI